MLLFNTTLFFHGCKNSKTYFSAGPVAPFMELEVVGNDWWPSRVSSGSSVLLVINLATQALAVVIIWGALPRLARVLVSPSFTAAAVVSVLVTNSFLFCPVVWHYAVFLPTFHVAGAVRDEVVIASRLYFAALLLATFGCVLLTSFLIRRYLLVDPHRSWQFRLSGFMALVVLLGTAIGLVARWMMHDR